ncbi:VOC family protein [Herbiconiux sp. L3-i23]|uniref:VOC family protein n=1 Tax=Herbiconiux sp. L3-i23 TaxID=2905871 RepID=UPI00206989DF|nr:VOC family protein [Herbiconiux sp. L3-i23]BDI21322.1 hypothetical protein L3i23_00980 [Herbiconiux sp. L3-i23]
MTDADAIENPTPDNTPQVSQLRVVIEAPDWEAAVRFYRDTLGLEQLQGYRNKKGAQLVLDVGRATIELVHPDLDDDGALSDPPAPKLRLVFQSEDARSTIATLEAAGAERVDIPEPTADHAISARMLAPDKMPISVFQPLSGPDFAEPPRHDV